MNFLNTFRARLLFILIILLIATLSVQYYLNLKTQEENSRLREKQEQALVAAFALGTGGITSTDYLSDLVKNQTFFNEKISERVQDVLIINQDWQITDSLKSEDLQPTIGENGETILKNLSDAKNLPPLQEGKRLGADAARFPNANADPNGVTEGEAHVIPVDTSKGRWYVMVILNDDKQQAAMRAAQPLIYTLGVLSLSTFITILLVWRFTRPLADLSNAAREVAAGNLCVRVDDRGQRNEMGELAARFNEMTAELEKKGRLEEVTGQFAQICKIEPSPMRFDESGFLTLKSARQLNGRGLAVLRELYLAREVAAIKRNAPPFKVISEDLMLRLSVAPREGLHNLSIFKGVSGYVLANHGGWIREALQRGLKAPEYHVPKREVSREKRAYFETVKNRFKDLKMWRKEIAARRNMLPEAIMGNDVLERLAQSQPRTLEDLHAVRGLGAEKVSLYGLELIEFIKKHHLAK